MYVYFSAILMTDITTQTTDETLSPSLQHHTQKQKESLLTTIGNTIWLGVEELSNTIWGSDKQKQPTQDCAGHQISTKLEKQEEALIKKRGLHED